MKAREDCNTLILPDLPLNWWFENFILILVAWLQNESIKDWTSKVKKTALMVEEWERERERFDQDGLNREKEKGNRKHQEGGKKIDTLPIYFN